MTAVEWLIDQMFKQGYFDGNKPFSITNLDHLQHQAKEIEAEQQQNIVDDALINYELGWADRRTSSQTEISDEEILQAGKEHFSQIIGATQNDVSAWISACEWYREQLKKKI